MSLIVSIINFIEAQTSLTADVDLFVGGESSGAPDKAVIVRESPSSIQNDSGMQGRAIQFLIKELAYVNAETLAETVFNLFAHKPGFSTGDLNEDIFYVDVINRPGLIDRDERGAYIFAFNLFIRRPT